MTGGIVTNKRSRIYINSDYVFMFFVYFILVLALLVILYPLYFTIIASISDPTSVTLGEVLLLPHNITFGGYQRIFNYSPIWRGYFNTILYTVVGTTINMVVLLPAAYALSRKDLIARRWIMLYFVFIMYFTGGIVTKFLLVSGLGLLDSIWAIVLPPAVNVFNLIIARTFFMSSIPDELLDSSRIDGATNTQFFFQCVLPLSKAIIAIMILRHAIFFWNDYFNPYIFLFDKKKYPLQLVLREILMLDQFAEAESPEDQAYILQMMKLGQMIKYCVIFVSAAPMLILYPFLQKYFVQGMLIGSVKG